MTPQDRRRTAQVLGQRARALARPVAEQVTTGPDHVIAVVGGQRVAVPVAAVREVVPPSPITRLPGTPPELPGVRAVRAEILCLVDTAALLGMPAARASEQQHVVVLVGEAPLGLLVDDVADLVTFEPADLGRPPAAGNASDRLLASVTRAGTLVLDPPAVLADPRLDVSTTAPTPDEERQ